MGILVACKAAELRWRTFNAILKARFAPYEVAATDIAQARTDFLKLSAATAQREELVAGLARLRDADRADRTADAECAR
jgi:hypothetical protein